MFVRDRVGVLHVFFSPYPSEHYRYEPETNLEYVFHFSLGALELFINLSKIDVSAYHMPHA